MSFYNNKEKELFLDKKMYFKILELQNDDKNKFNKIGYLFFDINS